MQADIERVRADSRQIVDLGDGMQKNEFFGALAQAMNFATIQPKLSQYCLGGQGKRSGKGARLPKREDLQWLKQQNFLSAKR